MDFDEATDEAETIEFTLTGQARLDAYRLRADELQPGEPGRAVFLEYLAEFLADDGRIEEARSTLLETIDDGGETIMSPRPSLLMLELEAGNADRADEILAELLADAKTGELPTLDHESVGASLEDAGRHREALRWFTMPLRDIDPDDLEWGDLGLLNGRDRVRRALGLPLDAYDVACHSIRAAALDQYTRLE